MNYKSQDAKTDAIGYKRIIEDMKSKNAAIREICLLSSDATMLYKNMDIFSNIGEEDYAYNALTLQESASMNLESVFEGFSSNRIVIKMTSLTMICQKVGISGIIIVIFDNREKSIEKDLINTITLIAKKIKQYVI
jgi:hypothetical protein